MGIDAQLEAGSTGVFDSLLYQGATWHGLAYGTSSGDPDVVATLASKYTGGKSYANMPVPDNYAKAIGNAVAAPDFETKQKYTQEAMKLMIDKYALVIPVSPSAIAEARQPYLHDVGLGGVPSNGQWTPEDAWTEKGA